MGLHDAGAATGQTRKPHRPHKVRLAAVNVGLFRFGFRSRALRPRMS